MRVPDTVIGAPPFDTVVPPIAKADGPADWIPPGMSVGKGTEFVPMTILELPSDTGVPETVATDPGRMVWPSTTACDLSPEMT